MSGVLLSIQLTCFACRNYVCHFFVFSSTRTWLLRRLFPRACRQPKATTRGNLNESNKEIIEMLPGVRSLGRLLTFRSLPRPVSLSLQSVDGLGRLRWSSLVDKPARNPKINATWITATSTRLTDWWISKTAASSRWSFHFFMFLVVVSLITLETK